HGAAILFVITRHSAARTQTTPGGLPIRTINFEFEPESFDRHDDPLLSENEDRRNAGLESNSRAHEGIVCAGNDAVSRIDPWELAGIEVRHVLRMRYVVDVATGSALASRCRTDHRQRTAGGVDLTLYLADLSRSQVPKVDESSGDRDLRFDNKRRRQKCSTY